MKMYPIIVALLVLMAFIFHVFFIMIDYAWYDTDTGAFSRLRETMNETLNTEYQAQAEEQHTMLKQGFGIARVICIGLIPVCTVIVVLGRRRESE